MSERELIEALRHKWSGPVVGPNVDMREALDCWSRALDERDRAIAEAAMLREALAKCGQHEWNCSAALKRDNGECDCPMRALDSAPLAAAAARVIECAEAWATADELHTSTDEWSHMERAIAQAVDALRAARGEKEGA